MHTFITLAEPLAYNYKRDTVKIYGNVVKATHGETRKEMLGSGDAAKAFQTFTLKQPPLTYVSAPTVSGVESTLRSPRQRRQWHEADNLAALGTEGSRSSSRAPTTTPRRPSCSATASTARGCPPGWRT